MESHHDSGSRGVRAWLFRVAQTPAAVTAFFVLLSLAMTYPLVQVFRSRVMGFPADNFEYLYKVWWFKHALFELRQSPFFDPSIFYPFGYNTALTELTLSNIVVALPLTLAFGEVVAYNVLMWISFVLSGLGMYLLVWHLSHHRGAALLSGTIFTYSPFHLMHLGAGHLPLVALQWLPLFLLYLDRTVSHTKAKDAVMAALFYSLAALSAWYYAYMFAIAAALFVLVRARPWRQYLLKWNLVGCLALFGAVAALLIGPFLLQFVRALQGSSRSWSLAYLDQFSLSPLDFLFPSVMHPVWGERLMRMYPQNLSEQVLFLGYAPIALALLALVKSRAPNIRVYGWLAGAFAVLAFGTTLHWQSNRVYLSVPAWLERAFSLVMGFVTRRLALFPISTFALRVPEAIYIPLPTLFLYLYLPFYSGMRVWARFGLLTVFGVAVLAGVGFIHLNQWLQSKRPLVERGGVSIVALVAALCLVVFEFWCVPYALGTSGTERRPVDTWLAEQEGDFAVMEYPLIKAMSGPSYYYMRYHGKHISFGQSTYFPQAFSASRPVIESFPNGDSIALLRSWDVRFVLVGSQYYSSDWPEFKQTLESTPGLRFVQTLSDEPRYEGDRILRFQPNAQRAFIVDQIFVYEVL